MERPKDIYLRRALKNWVARQQPPQEGRERLLWEASHTSFRPKLRAIFLARWRGSLLAQSQRHSDWDHLPFVWSFVYSFQAGISSERPFITV